MRKDELMICNRCRHVFNIAEAAEQDKSYYGIVVKEKRCPECGGTFRSIQPPGDLEKYLFVNDDDRYYRYY